MMNVVKKIWAALKKPSAKYSLGGLLVVGFVAGIIFWGGFHTAMEASNTETFCIGCHEMEENVYIEYKDTIHYSNRTGVRATCPDCHVPKDWVHKVARKIKASNELYHKAMGSVDTPEKFEAKRLKLARNVWRVMKETDSRECRNCHDYESMDYVKQGRRAVQQHIKGFDGGETCIDCHKGIAHSLPAMYEVDPTAAMSAMVDTEEK
jgi:nitrate/nitrite reductase NapC/NirT family c-type cytochrome